jgi:hypothetical protein
MRSCLAANEIPIRPMGMTTDRYAQRCLVRLYPARGTLMLRPTSVRGPHGMPGPDRAKSRNGYRYGGLSLLNLCYRPRDIALELRILLF